jgi:hypothetical protein
MGLATLQQAARLATPGPRAVAHADDDVFGFILATTPGTYRALTGEAPSATEIEATTADLMRSKTLPAFARNWRRNCFTR